MNTTTVMTAPITSPLPAEIDVSGPRTPVRRRGEFPMQVYSWGLFNVTIPIQQIIEPSRILLWSAMWLGSGKKVMHASAALDGGTRAHQAAPAAVSRRT